MRLIPYETIRSIVTVESSLAAVREAFKCYCRGEVNVPKVQHLEMPYSKSGALHIKSAHIHGHKHCLVKVASTFPENAAANPPLPSINGAILILNALDGRPEALLEDRAWITQIRTAAAGAIAAECFGPARARHLAIIGSGQQARLQTQAILSVIRSIEEITIWGRNPQNAEDCANDLRTLYPTKMVATRASAHLCTAGSDIIVTTTYSREPLLERDDVRLGSLVIGVGADAPYKCELSPDLVKSAGFVVVDSRTQNEELGDIARGIRSGLFGPERIDAEIGEILLHERQTRQSPDDTIICKLTGIAAQEAFVCSHLMQLI